MHGWRATMSVISEQSNIAASVGLLPHRAARLLHHLGRRGASVPMMSEPWTTEQCDDAATRGAHQSSRGEREFVTQEMLDFIRQGYWIVLPYEEARHLQGLRISPLGVVPQHDRRPPRDQSCSRFVPAE